MASNLQRAGPDQASEAADRAPDANPFQDLYERPGFLVRRAAQLLMGIAEEETARIGLTPPQHVCLIALNRCNGLDQSALGKSLGMDRATVGQVIRRLEARGLVARVNSPDDRRCKLVTLTSAGRRLTKAADAAAIEVSRRLMLPLEAAAQRDLVQLLTRLVLALNSQSSMPIDFSGEWSRPNGRKR